MATPLQASSIADLVATTLNELGELKMTDISSDLMKHFVQRRLMKRNKVVFDAGPQIQWDVITDQNNSAQFVGLYASDNVNVPNVVIQGKIDWRHITWNWGIDRREIAMNRSPRRIVDLAKTRRITALVSAVEKFENSFFQLPAATDTTSPYGLPYWIVKSATEGWNTSAPSGYTVVANINPTTYPRWANWAAPYTAITMDDLVRKWRKACYKTDWDPAVDDIPVFNTGDDYAFLVNYNVYSKMIELLDAHNDDIGTDLYKQEGKLQFLRTGVYPLPVLDTDTTDPIYGINFGEFKTAALRGEWLNESQIPVQPGQHTVSATHTDCSFNWLCRNRRRNFVISNGTTLP